MAACKLRQRLNCIRVFYSGYETWGICRAKDCNLSLFFPSQGDAELTGIFMACDARAGAYRVFSCDGSNTDDVLLAAADRALADGMDIINMCDLGSGAPVNPAEEHVVHCLPAALFTTHVTSQLPAHVAEQATCGSCFESRLLATATAAAFSPPPSSLRKCPAHAEHNVRSSSGNDCF